MGLNGLKFGSSISSVGNSSLLTTIYIPWSMMASHAPCRSQRGNQREQFTKRRNVEKHTCARVGILAISSSSRREPEKHTNFYMHPPPRWISTSEIPDLLICEINGHSPSAASPLDSGLMWPTVLAGREDSLEMHNTEDGIWKRKFEI